MIAGIDRFVGSLAIVSLALGLISNALYRFKKYKNKEALEILTTFLLVFGIFGVIFFVSAQLILFGTL